MNAEKILVDTSAWIASFKTAGNPHIKSFLRTAVISGLAMTSPIIILEIIQGCRTEEERDALRAKLEDLDVLGMTSATWERAYELGFSLRRGGLSVPTVDTVIAALAIENGCIVLHQDRHYEMIAQHHPLFRTRHFSDPVRLN